MCKLIIKIIVLLSLLFSAEKPYVLMVSFDGLRFDYTDWVETPNFDYLEKNGVKADGLIEEIRSVKDSCEIIQIENSHATLNQHKGGQGKDFNIVLNKNQLGEDVYFVHDKYHILDQI